MSKQNPDEQKRTINSKSSDAAINAILGMTSERANEPCDCPSCVAERAKAAAPKSKQADMFPANDMTVKTVIVRGEGSMVSCSLVRGNIANIDDMQYMLIFKGKRGNVTVAPAEDGGFSMSIHGAEAMGQVCSFMDQVAAL